MELLDKLTILSDAAKYDAACTSSGMDRPGRPGTIGSTTAPGCCHSFSADGRCVTLLKVLMIGVFPLTYLGIGAGIVLTRRRKQNEPV